MCPSGGHHDPPRLSFRRQLCFFGLVIGSLSLSLLLWVSSYMEQSEHWSYWSYRSPRRPGLSDPDVNKVSLVSVNGTHTLLLSSYMEHRTGSPMVRVLAVALRSEQVSYRCLLRCQGQLHVSAGEGSIHWDHFGFAYGAADILCPLPPGCDSASHIAVTSVSDVPPKERGGDPEVPVFLKISNQEAVSDSFDHNFTVCISTMFDFTNVLQLVQSLEMLRLLGVTRVVVYKTSCNTDTQRLLDHYTDTGFMEVIPWSVSRHLNVSRGWRPEQNPGELHYYGQLPALNECLYRYMYKSRYLALHDIDELILPQTVDSWKELLPLLEKRHGPDLVFTFENFVFPTSPPTPPLTPLPTAPTPQRPVSCCPRWQRVAGVNILEHLHYEPIDPNVFSNIKIIVNPRVAFTATVHGLLGATHGTVKVDTDTARMHHTRAPVQTQLTPEKLLYDDRLLHYYDHLVPAVTAVLQHTGLLLDDTTE